MLNFKPTFSLSSFTFIKRPFSSSFLSAIRVVSSGYLRLLIFLPAILIPACAASSLVFSMMYSAYKLNKHGDSIQPWHTPFPIWKTAMITSTVAVAKWLQSCPTLCDPIDGSPSGSWPWDSPGKNTGVGCHFLLQSMKVKSLSHVRLLATPWTAAYQAPPSMGFSRQEYWSGFHCFLRMYYAYTLNKQGDNSQLWYTPFPI